MTIRLLGTISREGFKIKMARTIIILPLGVSVEDCIVVSTDIDDNLALRSEFQKRLPLSDLTIMSELGSIGDGPHVSVLFLEREKRS